MVRSGHFCGCRAWSGGFENLVYCGLHSETVFAHWLLVMLADFVDRELQNYLARTPGVGRVRRRESEAFVEGCCSRICDRLDALAPRGSDLTVARDALIKRYMEEQGIELGRGRSRFRLLDASAHGAGELAGDQAQFNRPMQGSGPARRIGR